MASEIFSCWGQTASQLRQPIQALGHLSRGRADRAMGAMKPPPVKACSLYSASNSGIFRPWGQWLTQ